MIREQDNANNVRVVGIVCPVAWDKKGNIIDIIVAAEGEEEFFIHDSQKKKMLFVLSGFKIDIICSIDQKFPEYITDIHQISFFDILEK